MQPPRYLVFTRLRQEVDPGTAPSAQHPVIFSIQASVNDWSCIGGSKPTAKKWGRPRVSAAPCGAYRGRGEGQGGSGLAMAQRAALSQAVCHVSTQAICRRVRYWLASAGSLARST